MATRNTLAVIQAKIQKLQQRAAALKSQQRKPALSWIVKTMRAYGIEPAEITVAYNTAMKAAGPVARSGTRANKGPARIVPVKYRHPEAGHTWTGRGKPPRWLVAAELGGATREQFQVK